MIAEKMISSKLSDYNFDVPKELIAQKPVEKRDSSRLLVLDRGTGRLAHESFKDILGHLNSGDCLVVNRSRVLPARVYGLKETGGKAEVLFVEPKAQMIRGKYLALVKPFIGAGKKIVFSENAAARVIKRLPGGESVIEIEGISFEQLLDRYGVMPLPPYIKRKKGDEHKALDLNRYQTVYAREKGSIAAPTAGLHFTADLLQKIRSKGVTVAEVVLHVGRGTFKMLESEDISLHKMLPEYYEISEESCSMINEAVKRGGRIFGCGTTTVRSIESAAFKDNYGYRVRPQKAFTNIFIYPGYEFKIVNAMVTNLHLPRSTPLMMACAFAGKKAILKAYEEAVNMKYRFFSYGDAMLII